MNEARAHLRDHPDCQLCAAEEMTTPAVAVGLWPVEDSPDTYALRSVCQYHREAVVESFEAEDED